MRRWLTGLPARIIEGVLLACVLAGLGWLMGVLDAGVPLWIVAVIVVVVGATCFWIALHVTSPEMLYAYYAEHVQEAIGTLQKVFAGEIPDVTWSDWIERGVLGPARYWLTQGPAEEIRISVTTPDEDDRRFEMSYEAGHSVEAREKFELDIAGSFAGRAYTSGETQWTNDVDIDERWSPHPKARPSRKYGSLVSVPIHRGHKVVGVLNVLSTYKGAFSPGDLNYIKLLGSLIDLASSLMPDNGDDDNGYSPTSGP